MIISHKYKFIFIKTMKTAGTSIEVFLSQFCGADDVVTPIWPQVETHHARNYKGISNPFPDLIENSGRDLRNILGDFLKGYRFYNHIPARAVKRKVSKSIWNTYFKFCVERNPWDKTLSHYHMINGWKGGGVTLDEYIRKGAFCINYPMYTDSEGTILVDKVIRYEALVDELGDVFDKLAIPFDGALGVSAKSDFRKDRRRYGEIFTFEQRSVIQKAFAKEIEMHGYEF